MADRTTYPDPEEAAGPLAMTLLGHVTPAGDADDAVRTLDDLRRLDRAAALRLGAESIEQEFHADDPAETEREEAWNTAVRAAATTLRQMANEAAAGQAPAPQRAQCPIAESAYGRQCVKNEGHDRDGEPHEFDPNAGKAAPAPQPETTPDACRPVTLPDGQTIRVHGAGDMDDTGRRFLAEVVAAAKAKFEQEHPDGPPPARPRRLCGIKGPHPKHLGCPGWDLTPATAPDAEPGTSDTELTIYRAEHDSIVFGLYTTRDAAREHCEAYVRREFPTDVTCTWIPDDGNPDAPEELSVYVGDDREDTTGYVVTPLTVATAYDPDGDE